MSRLGHDLFRHGRMGSTELTWRAKSRKWLEDDLLLVIAFTQSLVISLTWVVADLSPLFR